MNDTTTVATLQNLLANLDADGLTKLVQAFADEQRGKMKVV